MRYGFDHAPDSVRLRAEDTDIIVALIRAAVIIAVLVVPPQTRGLFSAPPFMLAMLVFGICFTFIQAILFFGHRCLQPYRPVSLTLDLLLVTAITLTFARGGRDLFQIYYLVVITAAVWYRRAGAVITAVLAIILSVAAEALSTGYDPWLLAQEYSITRAPLLLLVAVITGYLVRARDAERATIAELDHELRMARRLQAEMLPRQIPELPELDIAVAFRPARHVGGDLYNLQLTDDGRLMVVLADMPGKSVYGLVHLSALNSHLLAAMHEGLSPDSMAHRVNRAIYPALQPDSYAALFIGIIETSGMIRFTNCGHLPPLLLRNGDVRDIVEMGSGGILIGAVEEPEYQMRSLPFGPRDLLVCYTDGISEVRNRDREQFGTDGVLAAVEAAGDADAASIAESIMQRRQKFAESDATDDATLLVIRRVRCDVVQPATGNDVTHHAPNRLSGHQRL
jgi:serine phosphatase RsbU (regulator of sigma subunit)